MRTFQSACALFLLLTSLAQAVTPQTDTKPSADARAALAPLSTRFAPASTDQPPATAEVPDFQKHVSPLLGRLGCNGRACHGSFQGQGDFRLSLFGYDFAADHEALLKNDRVTPKKPLESLVLTKPVDADMHEGGKRFENGSWEYWVLRRWIEAQAPYDAKQVKKLAKLEIFPASVAFTSNDQKKQLKVVAHWEDGVQEDVTCLCRYQTNDPSIALIDERGEVTAAGAGDTHVVISYDNAVVPIEVLQPLSDKVGDRYPLAATKTRVDDLIQRKLARLGVVPSELCNDAEFLRRVSLDVTGTLPTAAEVKEFVSDAHPQKRQTKIDELLERPGYAAQWATFLCDMTGNNNEQLKNLLPITKQDPASTQWYQWIYDRLAKNVPYDKIVEGIVVADSRMPGESYEEYCESMTDICRDGTGRKFAERPGMFYYWARNNFKTAEERAIGFAYTFLGVRIQCAQCHKHPFDQWTKTDFDDFEQLFNGIQANQSSMGPDAKKALPEMLSGLGVDKSLKGNQLRKELGILMEAGKTVPFPELIVNSRASNPKDKDKAAKKGKVTKVAEARLLGGDTISLDERDVRGKLMSWLRDPQNPYFAKALVNRVWAHYFSVGIVSPSDDLSLANAPSNAPLFDYLAKGFIEHGFDLKWLHREILSSDAYQRSWQTNETNRLDKRNFSHSMLRRLPAEATYDALWMALANDERCEEVIAVGRPRALTVAGASPELRGGNDTTYALSVFGRSIRESNCDCDRSNEPSLLQTVFVLNDTSIQKWLADPKDGWVASVAQKYGWKTASAAKNVKSEADSKERERFLASQATYDKQLQRLTERIEKARKANNETELKDFERRKAAMVATHEKMTKRFDREDAQAGSSATGGSENAANQTAGKDGERITDEQGRWIIEQAYLRALSRQPSAEEFSVAMNFLRSQTDRVAAVESLIWGMVNTKEFILNH